MRKTLLIALAVAPIAARAQGISNMSLRLAPQVAGYRLEQGDNKTTILEIAVPIAFIVPISSRISFDVATAWAQVRLKPDEGNESRLTGLTDTQVRLNYKIGSDALVLTAGLNIPTGQYQVADSAIAAAGAVGNDFFAFPVSSFGNGLAGTGGIAAAKALGAWNFGLGASFRKTQEFDAFGSGATTTRFEPGDEIRVRLGVDRQVMSGRLMVGGIYSKFGDDSCSTCGAGTAPSTYSTGDRIIGQLSFDLPLGPLQLYTGGWLLHHAEGQNVAGTAPAENIMNGMVAIGINMGSVLIEPSVEARYWTVDGKRQGNIAYGGVRMKFGTGAVQISPSVAVGIGTLEGATKTDLTGVKGGLTIRIGG